MTKQSDRAGGIIAIMLGVTALWQSAKLYKYNIGLFVGDHIFPGLVGLGLCIAGIILAIKPPASVSHAEMPKGAALLQMIGIPLVLFGYFTILPVAGYVASTWAASVLLFKAVGSYRWIFCILAAAVLTTALDLIFIEWLNTPFPSGILLPI